MNSPAGGRPDTGLGPSRIRLLGLPVIESLDDLAHESRLSKGMIYQFSKRSRKHYYFYDIPKRSGGSRRIAQPSRNLKAMQAWILHRILGPLLPTVASTAFQKGQSIIDNALPHLGSRAILSLDLEDFFPSVPAKWVYSIFRSLGYSNWICTIFTNICTVDGGLPQGSPSSPKLANLACIRLDRRLSGYVGPRGIAYTRYADDLTFSSISETAIRNSTRFIKTIIEDEGFQINEKKTRIAGPGRCHRVTGLIVTEESVGIGRQKLRELRARIYDLRCIPIEADARREIEHLRGWFAHLKSVDPDRREILRQYTKKLATNNPGTAVTNLADALPEPI